ncbi:hypothetical protein SDC9_162888 [bioreactor metagenome]|uniref:Uncharacterized protein n=1 Tax=bioreactor metagenome TaxID=1076179 RepID=A0A645FU67_9ZZZZ
MLRADAAIRIRAEAQPVGIGQFQDGTGAEQREPGRRGSRHRPFERTVGTATHMSAAPVVDQQPGGGLPRLFLAAHHQFSRPRRRTPVHPPHVIAAPVFADQHVVLTDQPGTRTAGFGRRARTARPQAAQLVDLGSHGDLGGGHERHVIARQAERIKAAHQQRADPEAAALGSGEPVADSVAVRWNPTR